MAAGAATSFRFREIRGVTVDVQNHATSVVSDFGIRMGCAVVEEMYECCNGVSGAFCLCCGKGVESVEHGCIDCPGIEEEFADDLLAEFRLFLCHFVGAVNWLVSWTFAP